MDPIADRVYGLVLGCALGDAVGLTTEFMTAAEAADTYDLLLNSRKAAGEAVCLQPKDAVRDAHRSKWFPGDWTDDTDQLVCVLRCLLPVEGRGLRAPEARDFAEQLMTWHRQGFPELGDANGCGMGRSTARVLDDPAFLQEPQACARRAWDSTGRCMAPNGALMRAAATGLRGKDHAEEDAKTIAEVTHADPRSTAACVAVAKMVAWMVERGTPGDGVDSLLSEAFASAERYLPHETSLGEMPQTVWACSLCTLENPPSEDSCDACGHPRPAAGSGSVNAGFGTTRSEAAAQARGYGRAAALEELRHALRGEAMPVTDHSETLGYVNTCLAAAIYVFRSSVLRKDVAGPQLFSEAIHSLAMAAGDADTNAAVAGALLGCALGRKALPELWLSQLPHRVWLEKIAEKLVAAMNCHSQG